jgi:hypothetical protein
MAIIAIIVSLTLPAIQSARESSRRTQCLNNLKQLGIALNNFESSNKHFPPGTESRPYAPIPGLQPIFYRWSTFAHLNPYLENTAIHGSMDLSVPMYVNIFPETLSSQNKPAIGKVIREFLCPSDQMQSVRNGFGPINYITCTGSGLDGGTNGESGGSLFDTDGMFFVNSNVRVRNITDGLSKTIAMSESLLGGGPVGQGFTDSAQKKGIEHLVYTYLNNTIPITQSACDAGTIWNFTDKRGFSWANGEYRTTLFNNYYTPNTSKIDCISQIISPSDPTRQFGSYGWRAARSYHPSGVQIIFADGSGHYVNDDIDPRIWRALATRAGGEVGASVD